MTKRPMVHLGLVAGLASCVCEPVPEPVASGCLDGEPHTASGDDAVWEAAGATMLDVSRAQDDVEACVQGDAFASGG